MPLVVRPRRPGSSPSRATAETFPKSAFHRPDMAPPIGLHHPNAAMVSGGRSAPGRSDRYSSVEQRRSLGAAPKELLNLMRHRGTLGCAIAVVLLTAIVSATAMAFSPAKPAPSA